MQHMVARLARWTLTMKLCLPNEHIYCYIRTWTDITIWYSCEPNDQKIVFSKHQICCNWSTPYNKNPHWSEHVKPYTVIYKKKKKKKKKNIYIYISLSLSLSYHFLLPRMLDGDACCPHKSGCPLQLLQVAIELVPQWYQFWTHVLPQSIMQSTVLQ